MSVVCPSSDKKWMPLSTFLKPRIYLSTLKMYVSDYDILGLDPALS